MADYTLSYESSLDASDFLSSIRDMIDGLNDVRDAADSTKDSFSLLNQIDVSRSASSMDELKGATEDVGGAAREASSGFDLIEAIELSAAVAAVMLVVDAVETLVSKIEEGVQGFAELNDATTRAAMMGGTSMADMAGTTSQITAQSEALARQYGISPMAIAGGAGMARTYGGNLTGSDIGMAAGMKTDPAQLIQALYQTSNITGIGDMGKIRDVYSRAYEQRKLDPTEMQRALMMLQPLQGQLGGFTGEIGTFEQMSKFAVMPTRFASMLNNINSQLEKAEGSYETVGAKGKVTEHEAKGLGTALEAAGLNVELEKQKGLVQMLVDLYDAGQAKGTDYFSMAFKGQAGSIEAFAKSQTQIKDYKTDLDNSTGSEKDLDEKTNDLYRDLNRMSESIDILSHHFGELFKGPAKGFADFISGPVFDFVDKVIESIKGGDWSKIGSDLSESLLNAAEGIDWKGVGDAIYGVLQSSWNFAKGLFDGMLKSNFDITDAISKTLGPSVTSIMNTLQNATITVYNALGDGIVKVANAFEDDLVGAIKDVIYAFADMLRAADQALGGSLTQAAKLAGILHGESSGGSSVSSPVQTPTSNLWRSSTGDVYTLGDLRDNFGISSSSDALAKGFKPVSTTGGINLESSNSPSIPSISQMAQNYVSSTQAKGGKIDIGGSGASGWSYLTDLFSGGSSRADTAFGPSTTSSRSQSSNDFGMGLGHLLAGGWMPGTVDNRVLEAAHKQNQIDIENGKTLHESQITTENSYKAMSNIENIVTTHIPDLASDSQKSREKQDDIAGSVEAFANNIKTQKFTFDPIPLVPIETATKDTAKATTKIADMMPGSGATGAQSGGASGLTPMQQIALGGTRTPGMFYGEGVHGPQINGFLTPEGGYAGPTEYYPQYKNQVNMGIEAANVAMGSIIQPGGFGLAGKTGTGAVGAPATTIKVGVDLTEAKNTINTYIESIKKEHPSMHLQIIPDVDAGAIAAIVAAAVAREVAKRIH